MEGQLFTSYYRCVAVTMSTINMVKYYFYKGMMPKDMEFLQNMISLAYQTARDRKLYPKAILIRYVGYFCDIIPGTLLIMPSIGLGRITPPQLMECVRKILTAGI